MNRRSSRLVEKQKQDSQQQSQATPDTKVTKKIQKIEPKPKKQPAQKKQPAKKKPSSEEESEEEKEVVVKPSQKKSGDPGKPASSPAFEKASIDDTQPQLRVLKFGQREYRFTLEDETTKKQPGLLDLIEKFKDLIPDQDKKQLKKDDKISVVVDHYHFTALEYFFYKNQELIECEQKKWKVQEDKCTICQFELYEEIEKFTVPQLLEQLENESEQDCIGLRNCQNHYFHRECLQHCIQDQHIKCPVCYQIYGVMTGDQPEGKMSYYIDKSMQCQGYNCGTIVISYSFPSGQRNGKHYSGTHRTAYLPNNSEGQEVLELLKVGFERKLLFTVGRSVTTGQDNTTVWNGVHHKTNLRGGSSHFGYPDPTYFDRVKLELAMKGVFPKI